MGDPDRNQRRTVRSGYCQLFFGYSGFAAATVVGYTKMALPLCHCSMYTPTPPCGLPVESNDIGPWMVLYVPLCRVSINFLLSMLPAFFVAWSTTWPTL